jgi:hypothetical protein
VRILNSVGRNSRRGCWGLRGSKDIQEIFPDLFLFCFLSDLCELGGDLLKRQYFIFSNGRLLRRDNTLYLHQYAEEREDGDETSLEDAAEQNGCVLEDCDEERVPESIDGKSEGESAETQREVLQKRPIPVEDIEALYLFGEMDINTKMLNFAARHRIPDPRLQLLRVLQRNLLRQAGSQLRLFAGATMRALFGCQTAPGHRARLCGRRQLQHPEELEVLRRGEPGTRTGRVHRASRDRTLEDHDGA